MKMEFIIDDEKCKKEGFKKEDCFNAIRKFFARYNRNGTIEEIQEGIFIGEEKDRVAFGTTACLTNTNWFLKVIKEWNWYVDGGKIDCIKTHYRVARRNGIFD